MDISEIDAESLLLIIELQLEDIHTLPKKKKEEVEITDHDLAADAYRAELESLTRFYIDKDLSESISREATDDGGDQEEGDDIVQRFIDLYNHAQDEAESSVTASGPAEGENPDGEETKCAACFQTSTEVPIEHCPCSHDYCHPCLLDLFQSAITDESLFPPRCCREPIPLNEDLGFLTPDLIAEFHAKEVEYGTADRTYCHQPTCSAFIPPEEIDGGVARCPKCTSKTCNICKGKFHKDTDCPEDSSTQVILKVAAKNGWQRCSTCRRIVELNTGCNHITCICGAEFCYVCGLEWKTCTCERWDEARLLDRAHAIANRNARNDRDAARIVTQQVQNLRNNHECAHIRWRSRSGRYECDHCHDTMPEFIYECGRCRILACRRCRRHRL